MQGVQLLPDFNKVSFPKMSPIPLSVVIPPARSNDLAFIASVLQLDPKKRLSSAQASAHPYFTQQYPPPAMTFDLRVPLRPGKSAGKENTKPIESVGEFLTLARELASNRLS